MTQPIKRGVWQAALLIGGALAFAGAASLDWIGFDLSLRLTMAMIGLVLVVQANTIPKEASGRSPNYQAVKRAAGWALVLAGLAYAAIWLFAPLDIAAIASMAAVVAAIAYVFGYRHWWRSRAG